MWYLVDAVSPDMVMRFVPDEGTAHWRNVHRAIRPNSLACLVNSTVSGVIDSGEPSSRVVPIRGESYRVLANPVAGHNGSVLAVQVWVGPAEDECEQAPGVDAFVWDSPLWTLISAGTGGPALPGGYPLLHGAWFLSRIVECERRDRLISAALDPRPGVDWQGPIEIRTADDAHTTRVFGCFRFEEPKRLRGLLLQVDSDREASAVSPTYHNDATVALLGGTTALIGVDHAQIIEWLTPPLPQIAWRHHPDAGDLWKGEDVSAWSLSTTRLVHPDDREWYLTVLVDLMSGRSAVGHGVVRLQTVDQRWLPVEMYCVPLLHGQVRPDGSPHFLTSLIRPAEDLPIGEIAGPLRGLQL